MFSNKAKSLSRFPLASFQQINSFGIVYQNRREITLFDLFLKSFPNTFSLTNYDFGTIISAMSTETATIGRNWDEWLANIEERRRQALAEADRIREALAGRGQRRDQQADSILVKLTSEGLSGRHKSKLQHELALLETYGDRHPMGEKAVHLHVWIQFGFNYEALKQNSQLREQKELSLNVR